MYLHHYTTKGYKKKQKTAPTSVFCQRHGGDGFDKPFKFNKLRAKEHTVTICFSVNNRRLQEQKCCKKIPNIEGVYCKRCRLAVK
jgi:hypothetical protein